MSYTSVSLVSASLKGLDISASTTPSIDDVNGWIDEVKSEIDVLFGKVFSSTTVSSVVLDYDGSGYLRLPYAPIVSVSSLVHLRGGLSSVGSSTSLTEGRGNDFIIYPIDGEIKFFGNNSPSFGYQNILFSGVVGYSSVPKWVQRLATLMVSKKVIGATVSATAQKGGRSISVGSLSLGAPSNFSASQVISMQDEIDTIIRSQISSTHVIRPRRIYRR